MLLFSTILEINKTMTKEAFVKLVIEWNRNSPYEGNVIPGIDWHGDYHVRYGDDRYQVIFSKIPSDVRTGKNSLLKLNKRVF